ncbi:MAG: protein translocase subunit SecD, partial [Armatimonadetes bacterium]|nr:protein translocase subunit SecD [Armatimonadota bacterium]
GVQLVLKARTQNTQYEFRLADTGADLKAALAAGAKPAAAAAAEAKAAPVDGKAAPAEAKSTPAESAKTEPAKAATPDAAKKSDAPKTEPGKPARDGGEPVRLAQAPKGAEPAPAPADAKDAKSAPAPAPDAEDAALLSDDALRRGVAERVRTFMDEEQSKFPAAWGEVHAEMIGSNVVVLRTFIKPSVGGADKKELLSSQKAAFENALRKVFPKVVALGEPRELKIPANAIQQVKDVIQRRVDKLGVAEAQCVTQGTDRVAVQLPGIKDPEEAVQMLGTTARLEFRKVPEKYEPKVDKSEGGKETTTFATKTDRSPVPTEVAYYEAPEFDGDKNILVGTHLKANAVNVSFTKGTEPAVNLTLTSEGAKRFDKFARDNYKKFLAVYLDGEVISAPQMNATQFNGQVQISGGFQTLEEANALKILLNAGSLPVPVDVVEQRTVSATLGADSINQAGRAGLLGTLLIVIIMAVLFRVSGWLANVALAFYCIYTLAALQLVGATLTMPGILGLLLSVGMAVDANVIVFERLKEEVREYHSRPLAANLRHAYDRSWPAILDGNVTAMMMAIVLYALGTGSIRGFAVTLALGIFCHLFTALVVTRKLQTLLAASHLAEHIDKAYRV